MSVGYFKAKLASIRKAELEKKESSKPFHGYNKKKHSRSGGLSDKYRKKYNRETGSNLKRPVTGKVKAGSKAAKRRKSFCARMSGVKGPTSKEGKLTPKGAALKRWKCSKSEYFLSKLESLSKVSRAEISKSHILMYPVTINGLKTDPHQDLPDYHVTLKWMGDHPQKSMEEIQNIVDKHGLTPPSDFELHPHIFHTPNGPVHVLLLKGNLNTLHNAKKDVDEGITADRYPNYMPHITVSKKMHDDILSGNLNVKDLDVKIHPLEYRIGDETVQKFHPNLERLTASEEMNKGSWQRKNPFNPQKDPLTTDQKDNILNWQFSGKSAFRRKITKQLGRARDRFLRNLSSKTQVRRAQDGGREFLLHRGHKGFQILPELPKGKTHETHVAHSEPSSWTPNYEIAEEFGLDWASGKSYTDSAWIHENDILTVPKQFGYLEPQKDGSPTEKNKKKGANEFEEEYEVIVKPHVSERANYQYKDFTELKPNLDERITQRGQKEYAHFQQPKAILEDRRSKKLAASEKMEKGAATKLFPVNAPTPKLENENEGWTHDYLLPPAGRNAVFEWQSGGEKENREILPNQNLNERARGLIKLRTATKTRKNPETGEIEYLLHRGHSKQEIFGESHKNSSTSWTPNYEIAKNFAGLNEPMSTKRKKTKVVTSAWFPESDIKYVTFQTPGAFNSHEPDKNDEKLKIFPAFRHEKEVIIKPSHKGQLASSKDLDAITYPKIPSNIDERINMRNKNQATPKAILARIRSKKLASNKKMSKSELTKALTPEEMNAQGYKFKILKPSKAREAYAVTVHHKGKRVGHLVFSKNPRLGSRSDNAHQKDFHDVYKAHIEPEHRGKGLYQRMLNIGAEYVKGMGGKGLFSEGFQRSGDATRAWDKVASFAVDPESSNNLKKLPYRADYFIQKSEQLKKMPKVFTGTKEKPYKNIWRMQNEQGEGPYGAGIEALEYHGDPDSSWDVAERTPNPDADEGFSEEDLSRLNQTPSDLNPNVKFGFENKKQAQNWFTPDEIKELKQFGFKLQQVKAKKIWSSGKQAFFELFAKPILKRKK